MPATQILLTAHDDKQILTTIFFLTRINKFYYFVIQACQFAYLYIIYGGGEGERVVDVWHWDTHRIQKRQDSESCSQPTEYLLAGAVCNIS